MVASACSKGKTNVFCSQKKICFQNVEFFIKNSRKWWWIFPKPQIFSQNSKEKLIFFRKVHYPAKSMKSIIICDAHERNYFLGRPTSKTPNVSSPEVGVKTMGHSTSSGKNKSHLRGSNGDNELSKKKAQEILDAFPLLDFMRSPTLMYPNSPITRPPDIVQTTANK